MVRVPEVLTQACSCDVNPRVQRLSEDAEVAVLERQRARDDDVDGRREQPRANGEGSACDLLRHSEQRTHSVCDDRSLQWEARPAVDRRDLLKQLQAALTRGGAVVGLGRVAQRVGVEHFGSARGVHCGGCGVV